MSKKQSLFSKAMQSKKIESQCITAFPEAIKLTKEQLSSVDKVSPHIEPQAREEPSSEIKAEFHHLSKQDYDKINEENIKLIQSMDPTKIQELQEQLREQLGSGLLDMFKTGNIYQKDKVMQEDPMNQVTQQFQEDVEVNLKSNYQTLQTFFKDYMQQNDLKNVGALRFSLVQEYQSFQGDTITLDELFALFSGLKSKGDLLELFEIMDIILDSLLTSFALDDTIHQQGRTMYRAEILHYLEKNLGLTKFLLDNLQQLLIDLRLSVLYTLEKWMSLVVFDPWCFAYTGLMDQKLNKDSIQKDSLMQERLSYYKQILTHNFQSLQSMVKNISSSERSRFHPIVLDLMREIHILSDEYQVQSILDLLYQSGPSTFNEMVKILSFQTGQALKSSIQLFSKKSIEIDFNMRSTYQMVYWYAKMMVNEEFNSLTNVVIQTISRASKTQQLMPQYAQSVGILFLQYDKQFNQNIISLFQINCITKSYPPNYFGEQFFHQEQEQQQAQFLAIYFQQMLQDLEYQQLQDQQPHLQLSHLSKVLFNLKFNSLSVVSKALRKQQKSFLLHQVREIFCEFLLRITRIRLNAHKQLNLDLIHVFTQITCRILGIVFYKQSQTEEVAFEVDASLQGYLNILYVKKQILLNDDHQEQALKYIERFFDEIHNYKTCIHAEYLLVRYMKFLVRDENFYLQIDQNVQLKFLNLLVKQLDWSLLGSVLNRNVSFFEKLLQKYTYDSFKQPIFSNILFLFTHPIFKGDVHNLILQEFAANADLENIQIDMLDQFAVPPAYKSQLSLEMYKKHVRQIQIHNPQNHIIQSWIRIVLTQW